jgi:poly-beta-1,6-N-acetyl-D-glucosamine synthase
MELLFWGSLALVLYAYVGYPCVLGLVARVSPWPVRKRRFDADAPGVSIVMAARNEARRLPGRIDNLLVQTYPGPKQIIIVSDGSTDGTVDTLLPFAGQVDVIEIPASGKATALNAGVAHARHDILVFADARQRFASDALAELVANFADPAVGGVTGELVLDCEDGGRDADSGIAEGVGLYWRYEKWIRRQESAIHSMPGATGAIYALRRSLWQPLPASALLDDVLAPMRAVLQGYRMVFDDGARAYDRVAAHADEEQRRKIRTIAGNYQILALEPRLLNPFRNPVWLQYVSHKVISRLLVPYALIVCFVSSAVLASSGAIYAIAFAGQVAFYGLAIYGAALASESPADRVPARDRQRTPVRMG